MNKYVKIVLLLSLPLLGKAQPGKEIDSAYVVLQHAKNDTARMNAFSILGGLYDDVNADSGVYYSNKAIAMAEKLDLPLNKAELMAVKAIHLIKTGDYPGALRVISSGIEIAKDPSNKEKITNLPYGLTPENKRQRILGLLYSFLEFLYLNVGDYEKQIATAHAIIPMVESSGDSSNLAGIFPDMGDAFLKLNRLDSALFYQKKSLYYYSLLRFEDRRFEATTYTSVGAIYEKMGNIDLARQNYLKAIEVAERHNKPRQSGSAYIQLANMYQSLKNPDSSFWYANKALEAFTLGGYKKELATTYRIISDYYHDQKNTDSSFAYLRYATLLNDSLGRIEKARLQEFRVAAFNQQLQLQQAEQNRVEKEGKLKTIAIVAILAVFSIIGLLLYRNNLQKQKANALLQEKNSQIERTLNELKSTQAQLIQAEKMASLGELTAGIAHEIQNPLNFVNNFSDVNKDLLTEMNEEIVKGNFDEVKAIAKDLIDNEEKINHHGKRADAIVKGMLQHSQRAAGQKELTDLNAMVDEYLRLAFNGFRAKDKTFQSDFTTSFDPSIGKINIVRQDIARVLQNLFNNAFYAVNEKRKLGLNGYLPSVHITTAKQGNQVTITVTDNGTGISSAHIKKIFQPFFTTKPTGEGTGLGLSLSYDIVNAHGGTLEVESAEGVGTSFTLSLPLI